MPLPKRSRTFRRLKAGPLILTGLLSLTNCGHITIPESVKNSEWCHPFKSPQGQDIGASCDDFLTSNPQLLNADQWQQKLSAWLADGSVIECTPSKTMIDIKVFIEDTCSQITCDEATKQVLTDAFQKIASIGKGRSEQ
jgi:hypothetical protein